MRTQSPQDAIAPIMVIARPAVGGDVETDGNSRSGVNAVRRRKRAAQILLVLPKNAFHRVRILPAADHFALDARQRQVHAVFQSHRARNDDVADQLPADRSRKSQQVDV
jgi:hypothetical protein